METKMEVYDGETALRVARMTLPSRKYHDLRVFDGEQGAQRICLTAKRGPLSTNAQAVMIKIDKKPEGEAAMALRENGHTTLREVHTLSTIPVDEAVANHLSPILDFYANSETGASISVEPFFTGAKSLKSKVSEEGVLKVKEFEDFMEQYVQANSYLIKDRKLVHRDQNPKNILLRDSGRKGLEMRLTDMTTAAEIDSLEKTASTTWGARSIRHFAYSNAFSPAPVNAEQAELYSMGMNAIFALTGMFPVYYDPINGTGISAFTGETILNTDGPINVEKHNTALQQAFSKFPKKAKKHIEWIKKCVDGDVGSQYKSIDDLARDFERVVSPTLLDKVRKMSWKAKTGIAAGLTALAIGGSALTYEMVERNKEHAAQLEEANRYKVTAEWDRLHPKIRNNLFDMKVALYGKDYQKGYPKKRFIRGERGERLSGHIECKQSPLQKRSQLGEFYSYSGQAYIEGYSLEGKLSDTFAVSLVPSNESGAYSDGAYFGGDFEIKIPQNIKDGVYNIAIATYAPTKEEIVKKEAESKKYGPSPHIKFTNPGKALALHTIPLIVGNPNIALAANEFAINGYDERIELDEVQGRSEMGGWLSPRNPYFASASLVDDEKISILGRGINRSTLGIKLPEGTNYLEGVAEVGVYSPESKDMTFYTAFPLKRTQYPGSVIPPLYFWNLDLPGKDFPEKLIEHRQNLERKAAEAFARTNYSLPKE